MIPHAITHTGSHVDLWSQLKATQHALHRAAHSADQPTALDRDLLKRLAELLKAAQQEDKAVVAELKNYFESLTFQESEGALDLDLRQHLKQAPEFKNWLATQKIGEDKKIQRLVQVLEKYLEDSQKGLIAKPLPDEEFKILGAVIGRLLVQVESSLHA